MMQCNPKLTPAQIKQYMQASGPKVMDPKNGLMFPSLRAFEAVSAACPDLAGSAPGKQPDADAGSAAEPDTDAAAADDGAQGAVVKDAGDKPTLRDAGVRKRDASAAPVQDEEGSDETVDDDDEAAPGRGNGSEDEGASDDGDSPVSRAREGGCSTSGAPLPLDLSVLLAFLAVPLALGRRRRAHAR
jgi:hypothetical protein